MELTVLELIKLVHDNYTHIQQLETLGSIVPEEYHVIVKTTQNSHYDYKIYTHKKYQDPENHIDKVLERLYPGKYDIKSYKDMWYDLWHANKFGK
jgi:hypothetical protein